MRIASLPLLKSWQYNYRENIFFTTTVQFIIASVVADESWIDQDPGQPLPQRSA
jgi:hypothetical protein